MKALGHAYVATHATNGNNQLLIIGALLPEMIPYIPNGVFDYQELHEGGQRLLRYLDSFYPQKRDLALGLLSHGTKFGADKYNKASEELVSSEREALLKKIRLAQGLDQKNTKSRLHNYVALGIDWLLIQNEPRLVKKVQETLEAINVEEISRLLAEAFNKDQNKIRVVVRTLFRDIYRKEDLTSAKGLVRIWARQASGLPEKDTVDILLATAIIEECANALQGEWRNFLETVSQKVRRELLAFSIS